MLDVGATAPDFESESFDGRRVRLAELRGKPVVLYFFPKAFTPLCTVETRRFRDNYPELTAMGAEVVGVSTDTLETQCEFARRQEVSFPLLADPDRRISAAYGVLWPLLSRARRVTFIISETGTVEVVLWHEFQVSKHLDDVLRYLRKRPAGSQPALGAEFT